MAMASSSSSSSCSMLVPSSSSASSSMKRWPWRSSSSCCPSRRPSRIFVSSSLANNNTIDHVTFIKEVAALEPPSQLCPLLDVLQAKGEKLMSPTSRNGIMPLAIPLSSDPSSGFTTALLRWLTPPDGMEMPVIQVQEHGISLIAKSVEQYIHRILVEEDAGPNSDGSLYAASGSLGETLFKRGDFAASNLGSIPLYLMKKVGLFPDVFEHLAMKHFERGDEMSALVTGEYYMRKTNFPGLARPFVFNAELLLRAGRKQEAKDAAKVALKMPWWTLGCNYKVVAEMANVENEQIEYMKDMMTEQGKRDEITKGKAPGQVALDHAAFLLDLASLDGSWDNIRHELASLYKEAGLDFMAKFVLLTD